MKKTKTKNRFKVFLSLDVLLLFLVFFFFRSFNVAFGDKVFADQLSGTQNADSTVSTVKEFPYLKTFIISAYYSPLPCQQHYNTGSYASDLALNGNGTNGADGTQVFPGMIAAPKSYPFGTKMDIPGIGIVAVHDRGGAIVSTDTGAFDYDRLDVWMGFGDKGLDRALSWGKRTVDVEVYGINDSIAEQVNLGDYSASESTPNDCSKVMTAAKVVDAVAVKKAPVQLANNSVSFLNDDLKFGDKGAKVKSLQNTLKQMNLLRVEANGSYDDLTKHAVFKFQQTQGLVLDENSEFAGVFGPKTRKEMNKLIAASNYYETRVAAATDAYEKTIAVSNESDKPKKSIISLQLKYGMRGPEVATLQKFLKDQGFLSGDLITQYYGPVTQDAVTEFQKAHKLITNPGDNGAGAVGPATLELINTLS